MLNYQAMKNLISTTFLIIVTLGVTIALFFPQKSLADTTENQIGSCLNQNNRLSMEIVSTEKINNHFGHNLEFNLRINNYSNQPVRIALHKLQLELIGEQGQNFELKNASLPNFNTTYFYREVPPLGKINFFLLANIYQDDGTFNFFVFNYRTTDWVKLEKKQVLTARFKYIANDEEEIYTDLIGKETEGSYYKEGEDYYSGFKIMKGICTGEFRTNSVKIDLSAY